MRPAPRTPAVVTPRTAPDEARPAAHPATIAQPKPAMRGAEALPPHPATVIQRHAPPHPANQRSLEALAWRAPARAVQASAAAAVETAAARIAVWNVKDLTWKNAGTGGGERLQAMAVELGNCDILFVVEALKG